MSTSPRSTKSRPTPNGPLRIALLTYRLRTYDPDEVIDRRDRDGYVEIDLRDIEAAGSSAVAPGPRTATDGVN